MGGEIKVESAGSIQAMIDVAKEGYERTKTYYEVQLEKIVRQIEKIKGYLEKYEAKLQKALAELGRCQQEIAQTEIELAQARQAQASAAGKEGDANLRSSLADLQVAELERRLAELHARKETLKGQCDYLRQVVGQCKEQLAAALAMKKDWEDRGREALERTRRASEHQQEIGSRQLAALAGRPSGR